MPEESGQAEPAEVVVPESGTTAPFYEYEFPDKEKIAWSTKEDLGKAFRDSFYRDKDYRQKTQELATRRSTMEQREKELEQQAAALASTGQQHGEMGKFLDSRPDIRQYILQNMRQPQGGVFMDKSKEYTDSKLDEIQKKLDSQDARLREADQDRQKREVFATLKGKYKDFDEEHISRRMDEMSKTPKEADYHDFVEMLHLSELGRKSVADVAAKIAESQETKLTMETPLPSGGPSGVTGPPKAAKSFADAAEQAHKELD